MTARPSLILVGGGLANGLLALKLSELRPEIDFTVIEAGASPGGNHTWSFHADDLNEAQRAFVEPLVVYRWASQQVVFPNLRRRLAAGYRTVTVERFAETLMRRLGPRIRLQSPVASVAPDRVTLADGEELRADAVIDGRGFRASAAMVIRFQSFVGRELRFERPHGVDAPIIMDASTPQEGGYRFTYVLPFTPDTALVEDTGYLDSGALDEARMEHRIEDYCAACGWHPRELLRRETGVLPITLSGDIDRFWAETAGVPSVGLAGNFFHPTTGYSLPDAVRVAELVASLPAFGHAAVHAALMRHAKDMWKDRGLLRGLNRMLFLAGDPELRWRVMRRFYTLSEDLIVRFYADRLTPADKLRILTGKPPVPFFGAIAALLADGRERAAV